MATYKKSSVTFVYVQLKDEPGKHNKESILQYLDRVRKVIIFFSFLVVFDLNPSTSHSVHFNTFCYNILSLQKTLFNILRISGLLLHTEKYRL